MQTAVQDKSESIVTQENVFMLDLAKMSFAKIAPFWPLKNLIAVNPLQGLEDLPIEEALKLGAAYFQQADLPQAMLSVNRETIKWLQVFFDNGQATIAMPLRKQGLYHAWRKLVVYDGKLHAHDPQQQKWLARLPCLPEQAIAACLLRLNIPKEKYEQFLTLMLTTLPGWAAYIKYRSEWAGLDKDHLHPLTQTDYLAMRLIITSLLWPEAQALLEGHSKALKESQISSLAKIEAAETLYRLPLLKTLSTQHLQASRTPEAQLVFCIDVRSEPFRRALELTGDYQTFGFAGFFGLPVQITDSVTGVSYASCPVLLTPKHEVKESPCSDQQCSYDQKAYQRLTGFKRLYQSVKYTFTTPFALVETLGLLSGVWMGLRSLAPNLAAKLKASVIQTIRKPQPVEPSLDSISLAEQCTYAETALRMMGLTSHFAPLVIFCGHGSATENNAYATALDCGACGGRHGASNARVLAKMLNRAEVKAQLAQTGITIPASTRFIAAEHNTTSDEVILYGEQEAAGIQKLKQNLQKAREANSAARLKQMQIVNGNSYKAQLRSRDWAQVRPEWGLARNAAFIVAPRAITAGLDLEGRCFLHSYDYTQDLDCSALTTILTAPMVVAQWINLQYLFSTVDNVAYGSGSKVTQNITGKMGIMQGNASDLMTGLALQSVYSTDTDPYHEPQRLMTLVFAPRHNLDKIIPMQAVLKKLFGHGWVQLAVIEPNDRKIYLLNRDFSWKEIN